ncbi:acetyltransferase (isoleucine patch superfamily) [Synechococcus sp. PCC 7502]|uniref:acyltransferase n=1 Tax=Synechococcus sp. PCC 7502 TaxID=1173263 RepID=UPI00029FFB99|nr:DapH/DapD/GlmU-related protein [Synechococcus sp. PCC 7502]AFY75122.1 acetyltransferase (isoleucine patch superfamily) [Synechococcus sp. PCC 7502]
MDLIAKLINKVISILHKIANKLEIEEYKVFCAISGDKCVFSNNAKVYNHSNKPESINLGNGITIDGILEVYNNGSLFIDDYTFIGNSRIFCTNYVSIGKGCWIADHVFIMDSDLHPISAKRRFNDAKNFSKGIFPDVYTNIPSAPTKIQDSVWIGVNCTILKGVTIGEGAIIGAGSVVTKNVPAWTIVAGNPARIIREIPEDER